MGRTRIVLLFNDNNAEQKEACDFLKSRPRTKTALVTELVLAWLKARENGAPTYADELVAETDKSMEELKTQITEELLQDENFIRMVTERISSQVSEKNPADDNGCAEDENGACFDFDEEMLLSGLSMFESQAK